MSKFLKNYLKQYNSASPKALLALLESEQDVEYDLRSLLMMRAHDGESFTYDEYLTWEKQYSREIDVARRKELEGEIELTEDELDQLAKARIQFINRLNAYSKNLGIHPFEFIHNVEQYFDYLNNEVFIAYTQGLIPEMNYALLFENLKKYMKAAKKGQPEKNESEESNDSQPDGTVRCRLISEEDYRFSYDDDHYYILKNPARQVKQYVGIIKDQKHGFIRYTYVKDLKDAQPLTAVQCDDAKFSLSRNFFDLLAFNTFMLEEV